MTYNKLFNEIRHITITKDSKTLMQRLLKLQEEVGELSAAVLSAQQAPGCVYKNKTYKDIKEEAVDVLQVAYSILAHLGTTNSEIQDLIEKKNKKWISKLNDSRN